MDKSNDIRMNSMNKYFDAFYPYYKNLELFQIRKTRSINPYQPSGARYNEGRYNIYTNKNSKILFVEHIDELENHRWEVDDIFEPMFKIFGLENFEHFIINKFGLDINNKKGFKYDWYFDTLPFDGDE